MRAEKNGVVLVMASAADQSAFATLVVRQEVAATRVLQDSVALTGAGDTVIATLALARSGGATMEESAEVANHAAGIVVGKVGTATVSRAELLSDFEIRNAHSAG